MQLFESVSIFIDVFPILSADLLLTIRFCLSKVSLCSSSVQCRLELPLLGSPDWAQRSRGAAPVTLLPPPWPLIAVKEEGSVSASFPGFPFGPWLHHRQRLLLQFHQLVYTYRRYAGRGEVRGILVRRC